MILTYLARWHCADLIAGMKERAILPLNETMRREQQGCLDATLLELENHRFVRARGEERWLSWKPIRCSGKTPFFQKPPH